MTLESRTCTDCGTRFMVTDKEIKEARENIPPGRHAPADCPEGLDTFCPACDPGIYGPQECRRCRPKQDGQRA